MSQGCHSRVPPEVFPPQMEGVKLIVTKTLSSHFQVGDRGVGTRGD